MAAIAVAMAFSPKGYHGSKQCWHCSGNGIYSTIVLPLELEQHFDNGKNEGGTIVGTFCQNDENAHFLFLRSRFVQQQHIIVVAVGVPRFQTR